MRYKRRGAALRAAGLVVQDGQGAAPAGDTVEIVRIVDGRGKGRSSGIVVRATDRFVKAYRPRSDRTRPLGIRHLPAPAPSTRRADRVNKPRGHGHGPRT